MAFKAGRGLTCANSAISPGPWKLPYTDTWFNHPAQILSRGECAVQVEPVVRMFDILRSEGRNWVVQGDLKSMLAGILLSHPGLEFLQDTPEFQDRYAETVILRIFYSLDRSGLGRITLRDLKRYAPNMQQFSISPYHDYCSHMYAAYVVVCHTKAAAAYLVFCIGKHLLSE